MSTRTSKAIKGTFASILQYGIFITLQIILTPKILELAGQEVLGAYAIIMQIVGYGILLDLGFSVALVRFLSQNFNQNNEKFINIFNIGRIFLLITNLLFALLIVLVALNIGSLIIAGNELLSQAKKALYILAIWTVFKTPIALYNNGLIASQNMATANIIGIIGNMLRLLLSILFVYLGYGLTGLITANICAEGLTFAIQRYYFRRKYPDFIFQWKIKNKKLLKEVFHFGLKYWGVNLAVVLFLGSDSIIVGYLYGATVASVFYTTKIPTFLLFQFIFKISDNAAPAINEIFSQGNQQGLKNAYLKILRYSLLLAIPLAVGVIGFNESVITAWVGADQYSGNIMTYALACFIITQVVNHVNAIIVVASGEMKWWSTFSIFISIFSLFLSYMLGKYYGAQWVMVAIALMDIPNTIFLFRRSLLSIATPFNDVWLKVFIPSLKVCFPLTILIFYFKVMHSTENIYETVYFMFIYPMLWLLCIYAFGINLLEKNVLLKKITNCYNNFKITIKH